MRVAWAVSLVLVLAAIDGHGQTIGPNGFSLRSQSSIRAMPEQVYEALVRVERWWNAEHTYSGDAANLSLTPSPGGCFCERLPNGGGVEHMRVVFVAPGESLRLSGGLGPLQPLGITGTLSVGLVRTSVGTTASLHYSVSGYSEGGFAQLAPAVSSVLTEQLGRLKRFVETGQPQPPGARERTTGR